MQNELLEALQLAKTGDTLALFQWKEKSNAEKIIADINDLLLKQRELCALDFKFKLVGDKSQKVLIDQESILNAKLI
jgi:hypothetical protein